MEDEAFDEDDFENLFDHFDKNKDGFIAKDEFRDFIKLMAGVAGEDGKIPTVLWGKERWEAQSK